MKYCPAFKVLLYAFTVSFLLSGCYRDKPNRTIHGKVHYFLGHVLIYDSLQCQNGVTCICGSLFIDMHGEVVKNRNGYLGVTLDAHRYCTTIDKSTFALFKDNDILWTLPIAVHHAVFFDNDSNIMALGDETISYRNNPEQFMEVLYTISQTGKIIKKQSFATIADDLQKFLPLPLDTIVTRNKIIARKMFPLSDTILFHKYFLHINNVQEIPTNPYEKQDSAFANGNLLVSDFFNNFIAIVDKNTLHIRWLYYQTGTFMGQHSANMLPDGRIMFFVNNIPDSNGRYYSAVRIIDPITKKTDWEYSGSPAHSLYSITHGCCQYLSNGNILIAVNNFKLNGLQYIIEVTQDGKVVWKWTPASDLLNGRAPGDFFFKVERI